MLAKSMIAFSTTLLVTVGSTAVVSAQSRPVSASESMLAYEQVLFNRARGAGSSPCRSTPAVRPRSASATSRSPVKFPAS